MTLERFLNEMCGASTVDPEALANRYDFTRPVSWDEQVDRFSAALMPLYFETAKKRARARSYRGFSVAVSAYAFMENAYSYESRWRAFYGMNSKSGQDERNICAEPVAVDGANSMGYSHIIGMVVVAETLPDHLGEHPTCRPCAHCRRYLLDHPLITPGTIIVTARPPTAETETLADVIHEVFTFEELRRAYGET